MKISMGLAGGLLAGGALLGGVVNASPVVYDWTSGSVTVLAVDNNNGNTLGQGTLPLTSASQVTFDSGPPVAVPSFDFADSGPSSVVLSGGTLAGDTLTVSNLMVTPASTYSSSGNGTNPYNITLNNLWASGSFSVTNGSTVVASGTFTDTVTATLTGQISLSGSNENLSLNGIVLDSVKINGTPVTIKADVIFAGAPVPLPAAFWLLGSGVAALAGSLGRRRREAH
jgi:hypothetical protein